MLGSAPRDSDSVGLGRGPVICISNETPDDSDAVGSETIHEKDCIKQSLTIIHILDLQDEKGSIIYIT